MESELTYLGCTAIEDKLQVGVPDTIATIIKAEIRFWVLTGDKLETAIEIARACRIIESDTLTIVLDAPAMDCKSVKIMLVLKAREIKAKGASSGGKRPSSRRRRPSKVADKEAVKSQENVVIVVEGATLAIIMGNKGLEELFY
jgi:magnesium-transporting ATPase (P-type)